MTRAVPFLTVAAVLALCAILVGCAPTLLTPPAHLGQGDAPRVIPAGARAVGVGAAGSILTNDFFSEGMNANMLNVEATVGLGHGMDLRFIGTRAWMGTPAEKDDEGNGIDYYAESGLSRNLWATALRLKWNPGQNRFWSMTVGGGQGWSQGQSYYSVETVQILGIENRVFVPYLNFKYMINFPSSPQIITWNDSEHWDPYSKRPERTFGSEILLGFKLPLTGHRQPRLEFNPVYLKVEGGFIALADTSEGAFGFTGSVAMVFPFGSF